MMEWTSKGCKNKTTGNLVSSDLAYWTLKGTMKIKNTPDNLVCESLSPGIKMINFSLTFDEAIETCKMFKMQFLTIDKRTQIQDIKTYLVSMNISGPISIWTGFTDQIQENSFINKITGAPMNMIFWKKGDPNGDINENCVTVSFDPDLDYEFRDTACSQMNQFFCDFKNKPLVSLRGEPLPGIKESNYILDVKNNMFIGFESSNIKLNNTGDETYWQLFQDDKEIARTDPMNAFPMGTRTWNLVNESRSVQINLNVCSNDEFPCSNGRCIPESQRCDQELDCDDAPVLSDEANCQLVSVPQGYSKITAPTFDNTPVNVDVSINLINILDVNILSNNIAFKFKIETSWVDSRLQFNNLKENYLDNLLLATDWSTIWVPVLEFTNTQSSDLTTQLPNDPYSFVMVNKTGKQLMDNRDDLNRIFKFEGKYGKIIKLSTYNLNFVCKFQLQYYPFDTQRCSINMAIYQPNRTMINLIPSQLFKSDESLIFLDNFISSSSYTSQEVEFQGKYYQELQVTLVLKRSLETLLMQTFVPTLILNSINQLTNYFIGPDMFEAVISINATVLMTLASLFVTSINSVPSSGSIK